MYETRGPEYYLGFRASARVAQAPSGGRAGQAFCGEMAREAAWRQGPLLTSMSP